MGTSALARALDNLEKSWSSLDWWLNFWTILVVVGVAVELVVLVTEYTHDWHEFRRGTIHSPNKPSLSIFGLGFLGAALVAIGVAGEFRIHIKAGKIEAEMRDMTRQLVATAEKEAAGAIERASKSDERSKGFESQIADAEARAAEANLKLAEIRADRHFTKAQERDMAARLQRFSGQKFNIFPHAEEDGEANRFAKTLSTLLTSSAIGWKRDTGSGPRWWPDDGILVGEPTKGATKSVKEAVDALVSALSANGIRAKKHNPNPLDDLESVIPIIVARKPGP